MQNHFNAPRSNQRWREQTTPKVSVVILGFRKASILKQALDSFCQTTQLASSYELILVLNGATKEVVDLATSFCDLNEVPLLVVSQRASRPGTARNAGVRCARAPITLFLDDDIICFQDMVAHTLEVMSREEIAAAGGPNLTPPHRGKFEVASGLLFSSWFGAFQMRQRYQEGEARFVDEHSLILCNLAVRTELFRNGQGFPHNFISNEENVVLQRFEQEGYKLWFTNKLAVFHERRATLEGLASQSEKYGAGRAQNILLLPGTLKVIYFLPLFFLFYLFCLPALAIWVGWVGFFPLFIYTSLAVANAISWSFFKRDIAMLQYFILYPVVHLSYGWGFLKALFKERKLANEHVAT